MSNDLQPKVNEYPFGNQDLECEFNRLGFDYNEIEPSVSAAGGDQLSEMSFIKPMNEIFPSVDGMVIRFEIRNFMNGKRAHIEGLTASIYEQGHIVTPIVKKRYSEKNGTLPKKEEIFKEMIEALKNHLLESDTNNAHHQDQTRQKRKI